MKQGLFTEVPRKAFSEVLRYAQPQKSTPYPPSYLIRPLGQCLPSSYFDQDFGLRNSSPTKKDRGFNTPVLLLPRRSPLVWVGVWKPGSPLLYDFAVEERIPFVTDAGVPVRTTIEGVVVVLVLGVK